MSAAGRLMSVAISAGRTLQAAAPVPLFQFSLIGNSNDVTSTHRWDLSADGQRFLVVMSGGEETQIPVSVVVNWRP